MKKFYQLLFLFLAPVMIQSCGIGATMEKADTAFEQYKFSDAAEMFEKLYPKQETDIEKAVAAYKAAEAWRMMNEWRNAESWYRRAERNGYNNPEMYIQWADVLKQQGEYEDAKEKYEKFHEQMPDDYRYELGLKSIELNKEWSDAETRFIIEEERRLNSSSSNEFAPSYYKDKEALVFTSDREGGLNKKSYDWTGLPFTDLWISEWNEKRERFDRPELLDAEFLTKFNDGVNCFNERGNEIYYTQCNGPTGEITNCRIMVAKRRGRGWGEGEVLPFCTDSTVNYGHPTLSNDGKKMFFAMNSEDGEGDYDIYVSYHVGRGNTWSDPVNLGSTINTKGRDWYPFIYKNNTLYFASNGHPGLGGIDIFESTYDGEKWSTPENLKPPVNTTGDDFALIMYQDEDTKEETGHFSSNRDGRSDDLYSFYLLPLEFTLNGMVTNLNTGDPVQGATVSLFAEGSNEPETYTTKSDGRYKFDLNPETNYEVDANKERFFPSQKKLVSTVGYELSENFRRDLVIEPYPLEEIELEGIYYGLDSSNLRKESIPVLDSLVDILNNNPTIVIELGSHTDCRASYEYNDTLSQKRAESVVNYLIENDIDKERLVAKGYGERELVNNCDCENGRGEGLDCTEEEHQQNRRTTFRILRTDYDPTGSNDEEEDMGDTSESSGEEVGDDEGMEDEEVE